MSYIEQEKERIIQELLDSNKIVPGQLIDYTYFVKLYKSYEDRISEVNFAEILEIKYDTYYSMKNKGKRARVLKSLKATEIKEEILPKEEKEKIILELFERNKIELGQLIDYDYFLTLYKPYREKVKEKDFANILEISKSSYKSMKYVKGKKTRILNSRGESITEDEKNIILENLVKSEKIQIGEFIEYPYFLQLYDSYKTQMKQLVFAKALGINECLYKKMKNIKGYKTRVLGDISEKINRITYIIEKQSRYYSEEEINELAKKYEIDRYTMIKYVICKGKERNVSMCIEALEQNGEIWIGETKCSKKFANKYAEKIIEETKRLTEKACSKFGSKHMKEDLASEAIEYILHKCGDIEKNFKNKESEIIGLIGARAYAFIKNKSLSSLKKEKKEFYYRNNNNKVRKDILDIEFEDKTQSDMQNEVEEKVLEQMIEEDNKKIEEKCIGILMKNVGLGLSREEALSKTGEMLDINPEEMLQILQSYMIKQNKVRQTQDGEYILGE